MLPGLLVLLVGGTRFSTAVIALTKMIGVQVALGAPFLLTYPREYLGEAFNFGHIFQQDASMNFDFLDEGVFKSKSFHWALLLVQFVTLFALAHWKWCKHNGGFFFTFIRDFFRRVLGGNVDGAQSSFTPVHVTMVLAESMLVGIVFSRSLHKQFYSWYFHTLPLLLWSSSIIPTLGKLALMLMIEVCWSIYPPTPMSTGTLLVCHLCILSLVLFLPYTLGLPSRPSTLRKRPKYVE